jgi:spermidine synthase
MGLEDAPLLLVLLSGSAALSWEVLWQLHASLAIGLSAMGTALTLVATMGGMTLGSLAAGRLLRRREVARPARVYAALEVFIGLAGALGLASGFRLIERVDSALYFRHPTLAPLIQLGGILCVLGPPAAAMGATVPVFGLMANKTRTSIAVLYGLNTAGAALGVLGVTFALLPTLGVELTSISLGCLNLLVAAIAWVLPRPGLAYEAVAVNAARDVDRGPGNEEGARGSDLLLVFLSGFVTLGLEVAWFRALRAAFWSTTDTFAILLTAVLVPLAFGALFSRWLSRRGMTPWLVLGAGGIAVLSATPLLERFDGLFRAFHHDYAVVAGARLLASLAVIGPSMALLGSCLPWVLARYAGTGGWARAYATNTVGAVLGSIVVAWGLLPRLGSERTAWLLGGVAVAASVAASAGRARRVVVAFALPALLIAWLCDSGAGRARIQGAFPNALVRILAIDDGPDSTLAVADDSIGDRVLAIDGFSATTQGAGTHYMRWMGRLPMMLHPAPDRALVICFGTGQTAGAVLDEGPRELDVVELNPAVYRLARYFTSNHDVLADPRVHAITMDGRAWLRRTDRTYDVITLEPMPPHFSGVNALYSREFYQLVSARLRRGGIAAQWLPFHILTPDAAAAIVATFQEAFGDTLLWVDPVDFSGILLGRKGLPSDSFGRDWPGFERHVPARDLGDFAVRQAVPLTVAQIALWASAGTIITDDNQRLAYDVHRGEPNPSSDDLMLSNAAVVRRLRASSPPELH